MNRRGSYFSPLHFPTAVGGPASEQNHSSKHNASSTIQMAVPNLPIPDQANTSKMQLFPETQSELGND